MNTFSFQRIGEYKESEQAKTIAHRDYKDATDLIIRMGGGRQEMSVAAVDCRNGTENAEVNGTLQSKETGYNLNQNNVLRENMVVRRLTPMECTRLQGFPDGWVDIGEIDPKDGERYYFDHTDNDKRKKVTDSAKYKALGNSIALPFWKVLARRIAAQYDRDITMGSLFSGIGGFELCFKMCGAKPVWSSEIEPFPIAVTTQHFGNEDREIQGDVNKYL